MMKTLDLKSKVAAFNSAEWQMSPTLHLFKHELFLFQTRTAQSYITLFFSSLFPSLLSFFFKNFFLSFFLSCSSQLTDSPESAPKMKRSFYAARDLYKYRHSYPVHAYTQTHAETKGYAIVVPLIPKNVAPKCTRLLSQTHTYKVDTMCDLFHLCVRLCVELQKVPATQ